MTQPWIEPQSPGLLGEHSNHYANEPVIYIERETEIEKKREKETDGAVSKPLLNHF